jgi:hypothetical protein
MGSGGSSQVEKDTEEVVMEEGVEDSGRRIYRRSTVQVVLEKKDLKDALVSEFSLDPCIPVFNKTRLRIHEHLFVFHSVFRAIHIPSNVSRNLWKRRTAQRILCSTKRWKISAKWNKETKVCTQGFEG